MSTPTRKILGTITALERPVELDGIEHHAMVAFPCNGAWRPVFPAFQSGDNQGDFPVCWGHFIVTTEHGTELHGPWQSEGTARAFARSVSAAATWRRVDPYLYQLAFGRVSALLEALAAPLAQAFAAALTAEPFSREAAAEARAHLRAFAKGHEHAALLDITDVLARHLEGPACDIAFSRLSSLGSAQA